MNISYRALVSTYGIRHSLWAVDGWCGGGSTTTDTGYRVPYTEGPRHATGEQYTNVHIEQTYDI